MDSQVQCMVDAFDSSLSMFGVGAVVGAMVALFVAVLLMWGIERSLSLLVRRIQRLRLENR